MSDIYTKKEAITILSQRLGYKLSPRTFSSWTRGTGLSGSYSDRKSVYDKDEIDFLTNFGEYLKRDRNYIKAFEYAKALYLGEQDSGTRKHEAAANQFTKTIEASVVESTD